jgi:anti-sigma factor RsiW
MNGGDEGVERMECEAAREQLLVADVDELFGTGDSPLAHHIRRCERCRTLANRILADQQALDRALTELSRERSPDVVVTTPPVGRQADDGAIGRRRLWRRALPLAAAAVLAALLLLPPALRRESLNMPGDTLGDVAVVSIDQSGDRSGDRGRASLQVEAPAEGRMAVFETRDPSITVVWFY